MSMQVSFFNKSVILALIVVFFLNLGANAEPEQLKVGRWPIVIPDSASEVENTSAIELATYLGKICGQTFNVILESNSKSDVEGIYVGWTDFAKKGGINFGTLRPEEYIIRYSDGNLIITGGYPRGTFYGVVSFLEKYCGVRWLTLYGDEFVPNNPDLKLPKTDEKFNPRFIERDIFPPHRLEPGSYFDPNSFDKLNRSIAFFRFNGKCASIPQKYGGQIGMIGWVAHTILWHLPPENYFKDHPEYYALIGGKRSPSGLCKANEEMKNQYFRNLTDKVNGLSSIDMYMIPISDNDGPAQPCECEDCKSLNRRYAGGGEIGQMLAFLNDLSNRAKNVWPNGYMLETLAYSNYEIAPQEAKINDDVWIRCAPIYKKHWDPINSKLNKREFDNLKNWLKLTPNVLMWEYPDNLSRYSFSGAPLVSSFAITEPADRGLIDWVQSSVKNKTSASLHLSLDGEVDPNERHVFASSVAAFWEPTRSVRPRLLVWWKAGSKGNIQMTSLEDSAAGIVSSAKPNEIIPYAHSPREDCIGGIELAGTFDSNNQNTTFSYLRFNFDDIPDDAQVVNAELVLSRIYVTGTDNPAKKIAFREVMNDSKWDPKTLTWNNRPEVNHKPLFYINQKETVQGYGGFVGLLPQPNTTTLVENIKTYFQIGVKGIFFETGSSSFQLSYSLGDLKFWLISQTMWNPMVDKNQLIKDFCEHYYGKAAKYIIEYIKFEEDSYKKDPSHFSFFGHQMNWQSFIDYDFLVKANDIFDKAAESVKENPIYLKRVNQARLSLDLLTLFNIQRLEFWHQERYSNTNIPFDRGKIEARYKLTKLEMVSQRYPARNIETEKSEIEKTFQAARNAGVWTLWRTIPPINY